MNKLALALGLLFGSLCSSNIALAAPPYQLEGDFESGTLDGWNFSGSKNVEVVTSPTRAGNYAAHMHLDANSSTVYRDELVSDDGTLLYDKEYWIGFSFNVATWDEPFPSWATLFQLHAVPGEDNWDCTASRNPVSVTLNQGELGLNVITQSKTVPASGGAMAKNVWTAPLQKNVWEDFVVHLIPSLGDDGVIEVFRNGQSIYEQHGPSVDQLDSCGVASEPRVYLKIGIYKDKNVTTTQDLYYDEVRIFEGADGYDLVAPPSAPEPTPDAGTSTGGSPGAPESDAGTKPPASGSGGSTSTGGAANEADPVAAQDDGSCAFVAHERDGRSVLAIALLAFLGFLSRRAALCVANGSAFGARSRTHLRRR